MKSSKEAPFHETLPFEKRLILGMDQAQPRNEGSTPGVFPTVQDHPQHAPVLSSHNYQEMECTMSVRLTALSIALVFAAVVAGAQTRTLTLEEATKIALVRNLNVVQAENNAS